MYDNLIIFGSETGLVGIIDFFKCETLFETIFDDNAMFGINSISYLGSILAIGVCKDPNEVYNTWIFKVLTDKEKNFRLELKHSLSLGNIFVNSYSFYVRMISNSRLLVSTKDGNIFDVSLDPLLISSSLLVDTVGTIIAINHNNTFAFVAGKTVSLIKL